jgi:hypothetical protein
MQLNQDTDIKKLKGDLKNLLFLGIYCLISKIPWPSFRKYSHIIQVH